MERTYYPNHSYWIALGAVIGLGAVDLIVIFTVGLIVDDRSLHEKTLEIFDPAVFFPLTLLLVCLVAAIIYGIAAYFRKRLVIDSDEVQFHGAFLVRTIRFANVSEAQWSLIRDPRSARIDPARHYRPFRLRLRTATATLIIPLDQFARAETEDELVELLHYRLGRGVLQNWEEFQALRQGRASRWGPTEFTIRRIAWLFAVSTGVAVVIGAMFGLILAIRFPAIEEWWASAAGSGELSTVFRFPGAAVWPWTGWLMLDWSLVAGVLSLVVATSFVLVLCLFEWVITRAKIREGRRLDREVAPAAPGAIQTPSDSPRG